MTWRVGIWEDGPHRSTVESDGRIVSTYKRTFLVQTDALRRPTTKEVVAAIGIIPGSPFEEDSNATCNEVEVAGGPEKTRPPFLAYLVSVGWATNAPLPKENSTDPTTTRVIWAIRPYSQTRYIQKDRKKKLIVNKAGQPFNGGIPVDARFGTAVATRKIHATGYDKSTVMQYSGRLNSKKYLGADPGTLQVDIEAVEHYEGAYHFWEETYTFNWDPLGWQPKPLNAGYFYKSGSNLVPITVGMLDGSKDTTKIQEPEPLTEAGTAIVPLTSRPDGCNVVDVDFWDTLEFETFNLL